MTLYPQITKETGGPNERAENKILNDVHTKTQGTIQNYSKETVAQGNYYYVIAHKIP